MPTGVVLLMYTVACQGFLLFLLYTMPQSNVNLCYQFWCQEKFGFIKSDIIYLSYVGCLHGKTQKYLSEIIQEKTQHSNTLYFV